jgi:putative aldouronate transport system substrate-binding protein
MIGTLVFAGGGQGNSQSSSARPGTVGGGGKKYSSLPFVADKSMTFTMFIPLGYIQNITSYDYKDNTYTRELMDTTGINLEFIAVPEAERAARLNLLLSSGDYPDIINDRNISFSDMCYWASQGVFVPLDDYHVLEYPNIKTAFTEYPALNQKIRAGDGKLYALPKVDDAIWSTFQRGRGWYFMPWVRDNNRKVPATLDELTTYLRWIRDNDVNGNGSKDDEVPLAFNNIQNGTAFFAKSFMPFVYDSTGFGLALYSGKITEQYRMNEYREALKYMASLYKEKLIKEDVFTMSGDQLKALTLSPTPRLGVLLDGYAHNITGTSDARWVETFMLPPMNGPSGKHWSTNREPWGILQAGMFITSKCKDPELVVAMYDYMLTLEMYLNGKNQKGKSWVDPDSGAVGLDGKPALYKRLVAETKMPANTLWYVQNAMFMNKVRRYGEQAEGMEQIGQWLKNGRKDLRETVLASPSYLLGNLIYFSGLDESNAIPDGYFIPPIALSDADNKRIADINAVLNPYKDQTIAEFVTGIRDITSDSAWNAYLADLDRMGSKDLVAIYQKYIK